MSALFVFLFVFFTFGVCVAFLAVTDVIADWAYDKFGSTVGFVTHAALMIGVPLGVVFALAIGAP